MYSAIYGCMPRARFSINDIKEQTQKILCVQSVGLLSSSEVSPYELFTVS